MGRRRRQKLSKEPFTITVNTLAHDGRGVGQTESGKTVFVDGGLPGETVECQSTYSRSRFDEARALSVLASSELRVEPPCPHYGICGGCSLQHLRHGSQIDHKQSVLHELLEHQAGITAFNPLDVIQDEPLGYRRKARLGVKFVHKKQSVLVGFREKRSAFITDISDCAVLDRRVAELILPLRELLIELDGRERIPQIEVACGDNEVALVFRHLDPLSDSDQDRLSEFAQQHQFHFYLQPAGVDSVHKVWPADEEQRLFYDIPEDGLTMAFHPMDFTQVNAGINLRMLTQAMALLEPKSGERVLDLFCGLGNFSLPIAKRGAEVVAVEGDARMVERGYENARRNDLTNVDFYAADLTQDFATQTWGKQSFDKILIDPPRSGALEIVERIAHFNAQRIVYVSCNPITLARDAKVLKEQGYELKSAGVMDMFPHTSHVESMALFER